MQLSLVWQFGTSLEEIWVADNLIKAQQEMPLTRKTEERKYYSATAEGN